MLGQSAKQRKTTTVVSAGATTMLSAGDPAIYSLPPELLEAVWGFLDVPTLCTARLVCRPFRCSASKCLRSVELSAETLRSRPETTLNSFLNLSRVSIFGAGEDDLLLLAQSHVAEAVTHLRAVASLKPVPRHATITAGSQLSPLPNLMSLAVSDVDRLALPFLQPLRELFLAAPVSVRTADLVAGLTNLTCLQITIQDKRKPFEAVTALTALQRLDIRSHLSLIPFVAELTLLTHLHFQDDRGPVWPSDVAPMSSLSRLHRLVHLGVWIHYPGSADLGASLDRQVLESVLTFTCLLSLDLTCCQRPAGSAFETASMMPFSQLTALRLESRSLDASFLPRFSLERLQSLSLSVGVLLDWEGVAALRRATGLTHLQLWTTTVGGTVGLEELGRTLPLMSSLRALSLGTPNMWQALDLGTLDAKDATFSLTAIAPLTELTRLELTGRGVTTTADVEVCLGLRKLRVLSISAPFSVVSPSTCFGHEMVVAMAKLPELRKLSVEGDFGFLGWDVTDDVRAQLDAERHEKGWPPLKLTIFGY